MGRSENPRTITKKELVRSISQENGLHPTDVLRVVQAFLDKIIDHVSQGDRLEFREFGVFEVVERARKIGRNPRNPSRSIEIPPRNAVKFTEGKRMKQAVQAK